MNGVSENFGWIEIVFTAAIAVGFGLYQLWSVSREIKRDRESQASRDAGHAIGEHELDDR